MFLVLQLHLSLTSGVLQYLLLFYARTVLTTRIELPLRKTRRSLKTDSADLVKMLCVGQQAHLASYALIRTPSLVDLES